MNTNEQQLCLEACAGEWERVALMVSETLCDVQGPEADAARRLVLVAAARARAICEDSAHFGAGTLLRCHEEHRKTGQELLRLLKRIERAQEGRTVTVKVENTSEEEKEKMVSHETMSSEALERSDDKEKKQFIFDKDTVFMISSEDESDLESPSSLPYEQDTKRQRL